jgi:hypothetical protein
VKRARQRGIKTVRLCQEIITLPTGEVYTCGHHTKNPDARCTMHRPPVGERVPRVPKPQPPRWATDGPPSPPVAPVSPPHLAPPSRLS